MSPLSLLFEQPPRSFVSCPSRSTSFALGPQSLLSLSQTQLQLFCDQQASICLFIFPLFCYCDGEDEILRCCGVLVRRGRLRIFPKLGLVLQRAALRVRLSCLLPFSVQNTPHRNSYMTIVATAFPTSASMTTTWASPASAGRLMSLALPGNCQFLLNT